MWIYTTWKSIIFIYIYLYIYMYIYNSAWHRRQKKQAKSTLFLLLSKARQCFSDPIGKQYLVFTHPGVLDAHSEMQSPTARKACTRDTCHVSYTGHNDLVSLIQPEVTLKLKRWLIPVQLLQALQQYVLQPNIMFLKLQQKNVKANSDTALCSSLTEAWAEL